MLDSHIRVRWPFRKFECSTTNLLNWRSFMEMHLTLPWCYYPSMCHPLCTEHIESLLFSYTLCDTVSVALTTYSGAKWWKVDWKYTPSNSLPQYCCLVIDDLKPVYNITDQCMSSYTFCCPIQLVRWNSNCTKKDEKIPFDSNVVATFPCIS